MKYLLGFAVVFALVAVAFGLGWNAGMDHQRAIDMSTGGQPMVPMVSMVQKTPPGTIPTPDVLFSPRGGCTQRICDEIGKAKHSIIIQAYSFTSEPIGGALVGALKRGVKVTACVDKKSNHDENHTIADMIAQAGAEVRLDGKHAISHSKVMVIDGQTVITGSFNFTNAAEHSNLENLLVIPSVDLAEKYRENFEAHWEHSEPYVMAGSP